jgi:predicted transcriptional regulator of viral defense system
MSIVKNNKDQKRAIYDNRFAKLARLGAVLFHAGDLASLWQMSNTHNVHVTLKRYADRGLLIRVYRGLYALKPLSQIDPLLVGIKALHRFAYVSMETVLSDAGIIQQKTEHLTLVSSLSRKFSVGTNSYVSRKLDDRFLYNECGIHEKDGVKKATVERAVADTLYFNSRAYFDADKNINWEKVKEFQETIGYPLTPLRYLPKIHADKTKNI